MTGKWVYTTSGALIRAERDTPSRREVAESIGDALGPVELDVPRPQVEVGEGELPTIKARWRK